jgi:hypothetical protein
MAKNPNTISETFVRDFEAHVSAPRFKRYYRVYPVKDPAHPEERDKLDAIAIYLWNTALSEALYPSLQTLEIAYRNALNSALVDLRGNTRWFEDFTNLLNRTDQDRVVSAMEELRRQKKPLDPPRVVAELTLGFWVSLYSDPYINKIVHPTIKQVFPNLHPTLRTHGRVQNSLQMARNLRNRIFHHEPIWHWEDLAEQHVKLTEAIKWMSRTHAALCDQQDRFGEVHSQGWAPFREKVDWLLALREEAERAQRSSF